ncbi:MAG: hypothetical protein WDO24_15690 [Pseudomonadota bacterium]
MEDPGAADPDGDQPARAAAAALIYDTEGRELLRHRLGALPRNHRVALDVDQLLTDAGVALDHGHVELVYDFEAGQDADGWLHAIFRYENRASGQLSDTSFGAHIFNTAMVYKSEPQSYHGTRAGLTTKLLLRLAPAPLAALCVLIYPASLPWRQRSSTRLELRDRHGAEIASRALEIACGGSHLVEPSALFDAAALRAAGDDGHVIVRDRTCRLFGYHALKGPSGAFCLDHMFGSRSPCARGPGRPAVSSCSDSACSPAAMPGGGRRRRSKASRNSSRSPGLTGMRRRAWNFRPVSASSSAPRSCSTTRPASASARATRSTARPARSSRPCSSIRSGRHAGLAPRAVPAAARRRVRRCPALLSRRPPDQGPTRRRRSTRAASAITGGTWPSCMRSRRRAKGCPAPPSSICSATRPTDGR